MVSSRTLRCIDLSVKIIPSKEMKKLLEVFVRTNPRTNKLRASGAPSLAFAKLVKHKKLNMSPEN